MDNVQDSAKSVKKGFAKLARGKKRKTKDSTASKNSEKGKSCSLFFSQLAKRFAQKKKSAEVETDVAEEVPIKISMSDLEIKIQIEDIPLKIPETQMEIADDSKTTKDVEMKDLNDPKAPEAIETISTVDKPIRELVKGTPGSLSRSRKNSLKTKAITTNKITKHRATTEEYPVLRMPIVDSEIFKKQEEIKRKEKTRIQMHDASTNSRDQEAAEEIVKHVDTLRKISVIAEEFNKKTAKNLKEIINSVQLDLLKKLEEVSTKEFEKIGQASTSQPLESNVVTITNE